VFDGTRFHPQGATVLVDGDRIVGVQTTRADLPEGVVVVEHAGTVLPGLIDCHSHLVADATFGGLERAGAMSDEAIDDVIADSLRAHVRAGVTTVRDLGDRGFRTIGFRERPGLPRVVAAGPPLTTPGGHCHYLGGVVDGDVRTAVAEHVGRGVDVIEHFSGLTDEGSRIDDEVLDEAAHRGVYVDLTMGNDRAFHALMPAPPPPLDLLMQRLGVTRLDQFYALTSSSPTATSPRTSRS
jgi:imidazolonepropionase-like amidohydrolase